MAKAKTLAALAGLAGLAYAMRNKGDKDDAGDQKSSSYAPSSNMTPIKGVGDVTNDVATNKSAYATRSNMTPMQGVGDATNDPLVKPKPAPKPTVAEDVIPTKPLATSAQRTDQLANLSRAVKREDRTKNRAKGEYPDASSRFEGDNYTSVTNARALNEKLNREAGSGTSSGYKTDAMKVASRAAAAADRQRRMAKQSAYKSGGMVSKVSSASSRADGIATKGKTRGKIC